MTDDERFGDTRRWVEHQLKIAKEIQAGNKHGSPMADYFGGRILALAEVLEQMEK
jgi:hypothetical protein